MNVSSSKKVLVLENYQDRRKDYLLEILVNSIHFATNVSTIKNEFYNAVALSLWESLMINNALVDFHPINQHTDPRKHSQSTKFDFNASFERSIFLLDCENFDRIVRDRTIKKYSNRKLILVEEVRKKVTANFKYLNENNLTIGSCPNIIHWWYDSHTWSR